MLIISLPGQLYLSIVHEYFEPWVNCTLSDLLCTLKMLCAEKFQKGEEGSFPIQNFLYIEVHSITCCIISFWLVRAKWFKDQKKGKAATGKSKWRLQWQGNNNNKFTLWYLRIWWIHHRHPRYNPSFWCKSSIWYHITTLLMCNSNTEIKKERSLYRSANLKRGHFKAIENNIPSVCDIDLLELGMA